jgi:sugar phosphate isomerase/epimerase
VRISFENATHVADVRWFWDNYAESITFDIGHAEVAGLDSIAFVRSLDDETVGKIEYVHVHRNNGLHGGITDHWPLTPGCREVEALRELLRRKSGIGVILELNETEQIGESLRILRHLRDELGM